MATGRIIPIKGTEAKRLEMVTAEEFLENEIHATKDQNRFFRFGEDGVDHFIGPTIIHAAADEAEMLALDDDDTSGAWPGDLCKRADTDTWWLCKTNNGELLADWEELVSGGSQRSVVSAAQAGGEFTVPIVWADMGSPPTKVFPSLIVAGATADVVSVDVDGSSITAVGCTVRIPQGAPVGAKVCVLAIP